MKIEPEEKRVKDCMHPVSEYPKVGYRTKLREAIAALKQGGYPVVDCLLVTDTDRVDDGRIVGFLTPRQILRGLEPDFFQQDEAPVLWSGLFNELCRRGLEKEVGEMMVPLEETVHKNASLMKALYVMDSLDARRLAVSDGQEIIGVLCLSDIYKQVEDISAAEA
ncbi:MAG: CBS domain-containing protein [Pseudomonadota bacterium]